MNGLVSKMTATDLVLLAQQLDYLPSTLLTAVSSIAPASAP